MALSKTELSCSFCSESNRNPRNPAACGHSFCLTCLEGLTQTSNTILCPICKVSTKLNDREITVPEYHVTQSAGETPQDETIVAPSATSDPNSEQAKTSQKPISETSPRPFKVCSEHKKQLDLYCLSCKQIICSRCFIRLHKHHNVTDAMESCNDIKGELEKLKQDLNTKSVAETSQQQELINVISTMKDAGEIRKDQVRKEFKELRRILEERQAFLLREVDASIAIECAQAEDIGEDVATKLEDAETVCRAIEEAMAADPVELVKNAEFLKQRCQDTLEKRQTEVPNITLPECHVNAEPVSLAIRDLDIKLDTGQKVHSIKPSTSE